MRHLEHKCASVVAHSEQPKSLSFEVFEVVMAGKMLKMTKSINRTLLAASALKTLVLYPLAHMHGVNFASSRSADKWNGVLSAVRDMAAIVLSTNRSAPWGVR